MPICFPSVSNCRGMMVCDSLAEPLGWGMACPTGYVTEVIKVALPKCDSIIIINPCKKATAHCEKPSLPTPRVLWDSKKMLLGLLLIPLQRQNLSPPQVKSCIDWDKVWQDRSNAFFRRCFGCSDPGVKLRSQRKIRWAKDQKAKLCPHLNARNSVLFSSVLFLSQVFGVELEPK